MLRLYFDEHIADAVASAMRSRGIDVQTAHEAGRANHGVPGPIQLSLAEVHQRVFVTGDWDFLQYGYAVRPHHGVILIPRRIDIGQAIRYLELLATGYEPQEMTNRVIVFPAV